MEQIQQIRELGISLGYQDDELRRFVKDQQDRLRDERAAARQQQKEELDRQADIEKAKIEKAKIENELELQKVSHVQKMELLNKQAELHIPSTTAGTGESTSTFRGPKIPVFEEGKDEIDSYLRRFERYATAQKWRPDVWATHLSALLKGKALDVYALMPVEKALDYAALKDALLKRYDMTEDGFKRRFRNCRPEPGETFVQFSVRLDGYFKRWLEMAHTDNTYASLYDLMLRDQFIHVCSKDLSLFLKERIPDSLGKMATLADQYREARYTSAINLIYKGKQTSSVPSSSNSTHKPAEHSFRKEQVSTKPTERISFVPMKDRKCFKCGKAGHMAIDCRVSSNKIGSVVSGNKRRDNSGSKGVSGKYDVKPNNNENVQVCSACTVSSDSVVDELPSTTTTTTSTLSSSCQSSTNVSMPIAPGYVDGTPVTVLRDTGCSGVVVKRSMVKDKSLTGDIQVCILADGTRVDAPIARVFVDTPYLKGEYVAWCMANPVYDLIIGNVENAREPGNPDLCWQEVGAVETRQQVKDRSKPYSQLKVKDIFIEEVSPDDIRKAQAEDTTLENIRRYAQSGDIVARKNSEVKWILKKGLIYRQFKSSKDSQVSSTQLVVPKPYRDIVIRVAHESIMSGHMGTQRTLDRVLSAFYWPGVTADVKRFCRSCDICQRTIPKGRVGKVPLQTMPLIDEPFKRVAVDLIGPLFPATERGNRYILTLVDYATRYPEAVALSGIETERVAEALVDIFSRIGVPQEMLTDMGSQFTSSLMAEVSRLISLKQLTTTVYHPMCNGLVERFNGSLKLMLKRMCHEKPKDWDRYLNALLFAYREVPQESLQFSPFELVYGRQVRGPMTVLKELWTKDIDDPEVRSTYQYVIDLRDRLEATCELARSNLAGASEKNRKYYNKKTKERNMKVGEKVLVLLPTDKNKLLMQWKGPYTIVEKFGKVDYRIDVNGKIKTFHANLLKRYVDRSDDSVISFGHEDDSAVVSTAVIDGECLDGHGELQELPFSGSGENPDHVDLNPELSETQISQVRELIHSFPDVFTDAPGCTDLLEHDIRLSTETPIRMKPYPIPYSMIDTVNTEVSKMLDLGVIERSTIPYSSPIVIVKKKDNTNRFCIDFRILNSQTVFDAEPMPNAEEMFAKLAGYKYFSRVDLSKGYWQLPLSVSAKPKTAFQTPKGLFQFTRMPFGLVTAPASFSRLMRKLLKDMENIDNFIDDIIIFTVSFNQHLQVLHELLKRLRGANLTARPSKCSIGYGSLECLGHFIGDDKLKPHPDKVEAIQNASRPVTKKQVRSFLSLVGFYRKFIPNFACVALPLTDLTKKGQPNTVIWQNVHEHAFQALKHALVKFPILKLPDMSQIFILMTDASDRGIGAVLMQEQNDTKMPVAYASRKLKGSEIAYSTIEKECLAIVWAIQKFQRYLYGREFILETDHKPLTYLNKKKVANARLMRWALILQPYRFRIVAVRGKDNVGADYLSRL